MLLACSQLSRECDIDIAQFHSCIWPPSTNISYTGRNLRLAHKFVAEPIPKGSKAKRRTELDLSQRSMGLQESRILKNRYCCLVDDNTNRISTGILKASTEP
ncbi:hypothetical protein RF11_11312 [Thelohanellus kitauei]|uniref:Uncharacterized protein n=1 Tax=Thelohanellus kitauei TaxID=669202 RepID=A0A0C2IWH2_THEKT|nr:hypothetical protein RF11_11312 [Thelohanellus kitauei]